MWGLLNRFICCFLDEVDINRVAWKQLPHTARMFALDISNSKRPPTHQSVRQKASEGISRDLLQDIDRGRVTVQQIQEMTAQKRQQLTTPSSQRQRGPATPQQQRMKRAGTPQSPATCVRRDRSRSVDAHHRPEEPSFSASLPSPILMKREGRPSPTAVADSMSFSELCETAPTGVHPSWIRSKVHADQTRMQQASRDSSREHFLERTKKTLCADEAIEIARMVARQEEIERRGAHRTSVECQVSRFVELELKAKEGLVSREERDALVHPQLVRTQEDILDSTVERHRARQGADRAFRQVEPQHMVKMASEKILKEEELESFGDELALLASKSDTARLVGNRNREVRNSLMSQLMSWAQGVLARGDLSDMLEEFIKHAKPTSDGSIRLAEIHEMMRDSGLRLSKAEVEEFNDAVDPRRRGCVVPERLRQVWRSHDAVRRVKTMDHAEAEQTFDAMRLETPGPITASFLSSWLKRTGSPVDADVCHTILQRLPRPITKETIFSDNVFQFLQDVWLDARASERDVLTDAGMMDRAKQLEALSADTNDTLDDVDRAARLMHHSSHRLIGMHEQLQETLEATAKLARRVPKTYSKSVALNTDVSVSGEMVMLWEGFLVQRDLDLLDDDEDDKLTTVLSKQNKAKADEIVRLRTVFESVNAKFRHKVALLSQKLQGEEMMSRHLRTQLEQATVGTGGMLDFEQHSEVLEAHQREVHDLMSQMNHKLNVLRGEHQAKVRELIHEVNHHKTRADEAERRLLEELESNRQQEARWQSKIDTLEENVRGREDAVSSTAQLITEYETKYELQEQRYVAMEAKLQESNREVERLRDQIEVFENESHGVMVPQTEVDRRLNALEAQLTQQVSTERASKEQFARQLQVVKSELQRLEFSSLDKCGALEQELQSVRCERDELERTVSDAIASTVHVLDAAVQLCVRDRGAIAQCVDASMSHELWVASSSTSLDHLTRVVENVQKSLSESLSPGDASAASKTATVEDLQRRLQQESQRTFVPPSNPLLERCTNANAELLAVTSALAASEEERQRLASFSDSRDATVTRVLSQLKEFALECINAVVPAGAAIISAACLAPLECELFVSTDELPRMIAQMVRDVCSSWKRRFGDVLDEIGKRMADTEMKLDGARRESNRIQSDRRLSDGAGSDGENERGVGGRSASLTVILAPRRSTSVHDAPQHDKVVAAELMLVAAAEASQAVSLQVHEMRRLLSNQQTKLLPLLMGHSERSFSRVTRDDMARLATHKRSVASAQSTWRRHLWFFAIRRTMWSVRESRLVEDMERSACAHLASLWSMRWSVEGVSAMSHLLEAIGTLTTTVTTMMATALAGSEAGSSTPVAESAESTTAKSDHSKESSGSIGAPASRTATVFAAATTASRIAAASRRPNKTASLHSASSSRTTAAESPLGLPIAESLASTPRVGTKKASVVGSIGGYPKEPHVATEHTDTISAARSPTSSGDGGSVADEDLGETFKKTVEGSIGRSPDSLGLSVHSGMFPRFEKVVLKDEDVHGSNLDDEHEQSTSAPRRTALRTSTTPRHVAPVERDAPPSDSLHVLSSERPPSRSFSCQVAISEVAANPPRERPQSHTRETQTPPLQPGATSLFADGSNIKLASAPPVLQYRPLAGTPPNENLVETPTGSQASESVPLVPPVDAQRRVDSAQRRMMVPRPQSSDRPRSAIRLDDESVGVLRPVPTTPTSASHVCDERRPLTSERSPLPASYDKSNLTWEAMRQRVQTIQAGSRNYFEHEFPQLQDRRVVNLDSALSYLFDALPPHCRVAAGKYCLLAMFGSISEDIFVEYVYTHHYLPNRDVFVAPRDDDLRRGFWQLRRLGGLLMRVRKPSDEEALHQPHHHDHHNESVVPANSSAALRVDRAFAVHRSASPPSGIGANPLDATLLHRPFSANSFPTAVVVLPLEAEHGVHRPPPEQVHVRTADKRPPHIPPHDTVAAIRAATPSREFEVRGAAVGTFCQPSSAIPTVVDPQPGAHSTQPQQAEHARPTNRGEAVPVVAVPVQQRRMPSAPGVGIRTTLPLDRSDTANGTIGPSDALVTTSAIEQTRVDLVACDEEIQALQQTLAVGQKNQDVEPPPNRAASMKDVTSPTRATVMEFPSIPTAAEVVRRRGNGDATLDAVRQKALNRHARMLPAVLGRRESASASTAPTTSSGTLHLHVRPSSTDGATEMQRKLAEYISNASKSTVRGPPVVTRTLAPLPRPVPAKVNESADGAASAASGQPTVDLPSALMRH